VFFDIIISLIRTCSDLVDMIQNAFDLMKSSNFSGISWYMIFSGREERVTHQSSAIEVFAANINFFIYNKTCHCLSTLAALHSCFWPAPGFVDTRLS